MAGDQPLSPALAGRRVLLGVTGGIAAYKAALVARLLVQAGADVHVILTSAGARFVGADTFAALTRNAVHQDVFERTHDVLHVRLAHQAELAIVAPATANVLARLALGLADDLLTSTLLEATCPLVLAPAMHTGMWQHPATQANVATLTGRGARIVGPDQGPLAAGDEGVGRMAPPEEVVDAAIGALGPQDLSGARVVVTAGPTHEPVDPVRFLGNRSSGRMGFAIAVEAARRGADVTLVRGPVALPDPPGVAMVRVETAEEMHAAVERAAADADAVVMAAAVADFRPAEPAAGKIKKQDGVPILRLEPTTDILAALGASKDGRALVGFAAETAGASGPQGLEAEGRRKLEAKGVDLLVVNEVGREGTGFGADTDFAAILARDGTGTSLREWTKAELAAAICDRLADLLGSSGRDGGR
jgi:phosphopantothenoylcysteine decarboxylase / phosphopantothenate---cysteine ligase